MRSRWQELGRLEKALVIITSPVWISLTVVGLVALGLVWGIGMGIELVEDWIENI